MSNTTIQQYPSDDTRASRRNLHGTDPNFSMTPQVPGIDAIRSGPVLRHHRLANNERPTSSGRPQHRGHGRAKRSLRKYVIMMICAAAVLIGSLVSSVAAIATTIAEKGCPELVGSNTQAWMAISLIILVISLFCTIVLCIIHRKVTRKARNDDEQWFELQHMDKSLPPDPPLGSAESTKDSTSQGIAARIRENMSPAERRASSVSQSEAIRRSMRHSTRVIRGNISDLQDAMSSQAVVPIPTSSMSRESAEVPPETSKQFYHAPRGRKVSHTRGVPSENFFNGLILDE